MAVIVNATPGDPAANSYLTVAEFNAYLETVWEVSESANTPDDAALVIHATRMLNYYLAGRRTLVRENGQPSYYYTTPHWTGSPSTTTQALPWPRTGMYDLNGNAIAVDVIPQGLKDATAELARQMKVGDRTLDNDVAVQGIKSVSAGSVSVSFTDGGIATLKVLPDAVLLLLVPSWITDEVYELTNAAFFDVVSD